MGRDGRSDAKPLERRLFNPCRFEVNMNPEQFIRKYEDTHTELQALEKFQENKSLIKVHPEDKNIKLNKEIPGKHLIEAVETEKRAEGLQHVLLDACSARINDLMEIPMEKLVGLTIKMIPQKIDAKVDANFSLVNLIQRAHTVDDIDADE